MHGLINFHSNNVQLLINDSEDVNVCAKHNDDDNLQHASSAHKSLLFDNDVVEMFNL